MNTSHALTKQELVSIRSRAFKKAREFFYNRSYEEVDCPILSKFAALDNHIDLFRTDTKTPYFLHSSPEYGMKKLLSEGAGSIFQLSHVFRAGENGSKHLSEFMMLEFYKLGVSYADFIEETCQFIELFTGKKDRVFLSYKQAFMKHLNLDPYKDIELIQTLVQEKVGLNTDGMNQDDILSVAMSALIEPFFDHDRLTIICDFPQTQAALASSGFDEEGNHIAYRFEIYHQNLELANGYNELKCEKELKMRFDRLNSLRVAQNKDHYPLDEELLSKMSSHFPDCCGVACGFDRLLMIELNTTDIHDVIPLVGI